VVLGTLTLIIFSIPTGRRGWIEDVVVDEGARGAGVGEKLTNAAIDEARVRGVRSIDLTSRPVGIEKMISVRVPSTTPFSVATNSVAASECTMRSTSLIVRVRGCEESWGSSLFNPSTTSGVAN
jgi:predicted GNAT family acetyltransferase